MTLMVFAFIYFEVTVRILAEVVTDGDQARLGINAEELSGPAIATDQLVPYLMANSD